MSENGKNLNVWKPVLDLALMLAILAMLVVNFWTECNTRHAVEKLCDRIEGAPANQLLRLERLERKYRDLERALVGVLQREQAAAKVRAAAKAPAPEPEEGKVDDAE